MGLSLSKFVAMGDLSRLKEIQPSLLEEINKGYRNNRTKDIVPTIHANTKLTAVELEPIIVSNNEDIANGTSAILFMNTEEENIQPIIGNQILPKCLKTRY